MSDAARQLDPSAGWPGGPGRISFSASLPPGALLVGFQLDAVVSPSGLAVEHPAARPGLND
jgi:hypothetical protein